MGIFKDWLNEMATRHVIDLGDNIPTSGERDEVGFPRMTRPGFRLQDKKFIIRDSPSVEARMNAGTEHFGIHWLIGYIAPQEGLKELDPDDWQKYRKSTDARMGQELTRWGQEEKSIIPPPSPNNTIVYVKPTSRVHTVNAHQQIHNIGHAIWLRNPQQMNQAKETLKQFAKLQQSHNEAADSFSNKIDIEQEPSEAEITIVLARVLGLQMLTRTLTMKPGDLDKPAKVAMTGFNAFDEVIFDLFPAFINAKGKLNLYPREGCRIAPFNKKAAIPPNQEVIQKKGVRPWVWAELSPEICKELPNISKTMTSIIIQCLKQSVWAVKGAPIYPYEKLTTLP